MVKFEIPLPPWDRRAASDERLEEGRKGMESLKMKINASKFASLWRREMGRGNHYVIIVTSPCIVYTMAFVASHLLLAGHFACWKLHLV